MKADARRKADAQKGWIVLLCVLCETFANFAVKASSVLNQQ
jgi:hypothetical protein